MKYLKNIYLLLAIALILSACSDDSSSTGPDTDPDTASSSEKEFVWNAMNEWYLYQDEAADLADDRFDGDQAFQEYLEPFSNGESLFDDLVVDDDPYSFFIENYEEYEDRQDGVQAALGFEYGFIELRDGSIIGYVQYIIPDSPSEKAGLERGQIFTRVDGESLTDDNLNTILGGKSSHELTLAELKDNTISETGETVTIQSDEVEENPIYISTVIDTSNTKIGYLMYNAFHSNTHRALNDSLGKLKAEGIDELVLDLRYNLGGAVITSRTLASIISGVSSSNTFAKFSYNEKKSEFNNSDSFLDKVPIQDDEGEFKQNNQGEFVNTVPMNTLSLDRLYVLTSQNTASASEALINGLRPFMDVIIIGNTTEGKDVGSITLYDAPPDYSNKDNINSDHKNAIQPIVVQITNSKNNEYPDGFTPDNNNQIREIDYLEDIAPIGSPDDQLLGRAIALITGQATNKASTLKTSSALQNAKMLMSSKELKPHSGEMYIEPYMMPRQK